MQWTPDSKVLIQGINEPLGAYYAPRMKVYGTNIVAGISVGHGGEQLDEIPIFDLVEEAIAQVGEIDISLIFTSPYRVLDAAFEAIAAGIKQLIIIPNGVPSLDMVSLLKKAQANTFVLGAGSHGLMLPDKLWLGISEPKFYTPGKVGIISRTDGLSEEVVLTLTKAGMGQSISVSLGTSEIIGSSYEQWLQILEEDDATEAIVLLGQPNSSAEIAAAQYIASAIEKPVIAYIAGLQAPIERSYGDAATIVATQLFYSHPATSIDKQIAAAFKSAKVNIAKRISEIPKLLQKYLK